MKWLSLLSIVAPSIAFGQEPTVQADRKLENFMTRPHIF